MIRNQAFELHQFGNGVTVVGEHIEGVASAAISLLIPIGAAHDPMGEEGSAGVLSELLQKGAGKYDARALSAEFERCGILRSHSAGGEVTVFSMSLLAENVPRALELAALTILEPTLPADELEGVRELALQDIEAIEDEPASKAMHELAARFYPFPFGRSQLGTIEGVKALTVGSLRSVYEGQFRDQPLIIGIAGSFEWTAVLKQIEELFAPWRGSAAPLSVPPPAAHGSVHHIDKDSAQVQIALAYPSVSLDSPEYYVARVAMGVLSGGMAGRLFVEVREKRGLVYRVGASLSAARGRGAVFASAGTTPENAQETLDVMLRELRGLAQGVTPAELSRATVELKSSLIMQSELSSVRAGALVSDWWNIRRLRPLTEIQRAIEAVTPESIIEYQRKYPVRPITLVTLGSKRVEMPHEM